METIKLRKLTLKSKLGFGKYSDETVQHLIDRKGRKAICYLRWAYFNLSKISFVDDLLINVLKISKEDLIQKPSTNHNQEIKDKYYFNYNNTNGFQGANIMKKGIIKRVNKISTKKEYNRSFNQNK